MPNNIEDPQNAMNVANNPFLQPTQTPFSAPDFDAIRFQHYEPAFVEGIKQHDEEIQNIVNNVEEPSFENTIEALESSGTLLTRVSSTFFAVSAADTNDAYIALEEKIAPMLSLHSSRIALNEKLFARIKAVYDADQTHLNDEQKRLLKLYYESYVKDGALLEEDKKSRLAHINQEIARLTTEFGNRLTKASAVPILFNNANELQGLSQHEIEQAALQATQEGFEGKYLLRLENTTQHPLLAKLACRESRQRIYNLGIHRCDAGNEFDTQKMIIQIAALRAEKAQLMGFPSFAHWQLTDTLAKTPDNVNSLLKRLATLAHSKVNAEAKRIEQFAKQKQGEHFTLMPWDWAFFAEQLRKEQYGVDEELLSQYFELDRVLHDGVFFAANQMYGLTFEKRTDISVYHPDVSVYDVIDKNGQALALFYFDPYARPSKSGGAWMGNFVEQSFLLKHKPVIYNVCNYTKPAQQKPTLLSWDNVTTLFHEFGHALHGMFAAQTYPMISGTNVPRDFVEMPSQFNELVAELPHIFQNFAIHYKTKEVMPQHLQDSMKRAAKFNQAYPLIENIAACVLDMAWHAFRPEQLASFSNIEQFEYKALNDFGVYYDAIPPRYKSTYFRHIWSHDYCAAYYSYLWAEALCNDVFQSMMKSGGATLENGQRLRTTILSKGNSDDLMKLFERFTGHEEVDIHPLLAARGLE